MSQLKKLQDTLNSLRLGEAADYLPTLLDKAEKMGIHMLLSSRIS